MRKIILILAIAVAGIFLFTAIFFDRSYTLQVNLLEGIIPAASQSLNPEINPLIKIDADLDAAADASRIRAEPDIELQKPLENPPKIVKAIYSTGWSAGSERKISSLIDLIKKTELNAIVIDIKDFSGYLLYNTELELPKKYNALQIRIPRLNALIKRLHDEGIYVIARLSVFQDPRLSLARPDLALKSSSTKKIWKDKQGLAWIDPAATESWDYNIEIAKEALSRGFDEVNFDYIRFVSDGDLDDIVYPFWDQKISMRKIIKSFFEYLRHNLPGAVISADLFGLVTVTPDDLGIGQYLEDALPFFDYIAPMVYPSHYFTGFLGHKNPAKYPYEVIRYSMDTALNRLKAFKKSILLQSASTTTPPSRFDPEKLAKFRPWLQDFDLGANYNAAMVKKGIQAVYDSATGTASADLMPGWMLWNARNVYTQGALEHNAGVAD